MDSPRRRQLVDTADLRSSAEAAEMIGCHPRHLNTYKRRYKDFPEPVLASPDYYHVDDLAAWMKKHPRRDPGPRRAT